jgi:hypothetical protein
MTNLVVSQEAAVRHGRLVREQTDRLKDSNVSSSADFRVHAVDGGRLVRRFGGVRLDVAVVLGG